MTPDTNTELILNSLDKVFDQIVDTNTLLRELIDFEKETIGLQSDAWKLDDDEKKADYPSGISKDHHLHIQQEGLSGAAEDLLKATRAGNQNAVNEATYCALIRLIQIVDNLAKRNFEK